MRHASLVGACALCRLVRGSRLLLGAVALAALACTGEIGDSGLEPSSPERRGDIGEPDGTDPSLPRAEADDPTQEIDPNTLGQQDLFSCEDETGSSPARIRRIGRLEWVRNNGITYAAPGLHNGLANPLDDNPADRFSSFASDETLDSVALDLYLESLQYASTGWNHGYLQPPQLFLDDATRRCIYGADRPQDTTGCVESFARALLQHGAYFREPTPEEEGHLVEFALGVLEAETDSSERIASIRRIVAAAWTTAGALFRSELGVGEPDAAGRRRLGGWELAQQLAYAIGGRAAGAPATGAADPEGHYAELVAAAEDGRIEDPGFISQYIRDHAAGMDPGRLDLAETRDERWRQRRGVYWLATGIAGFFRELFGYEDLSAAFKDDPGATSQFDTGDGTDQTYLNRSYVRQLALDYNAEPIFVEQLDDMIARVVAEDADVFASLLTTRSYYLASTVSTYPDDSAATGSKYAYRRSQWPYNIREEVPDTREGRWVTVPSDERAGVLSHPAWLTAHGGNFEDDPSLIERGLWIRNNLLCEPGPSLEGVMVDARVGPRAEDKTARDRVVEATSQAECQGCHDLMNPLGFPFEIYNHAGFVRVTDHGGPPDGSSVLENMPDPSLDGPVRDAVELSEKLAASDHVKRCLIRQTFRYFMGRPETAADACTLARMEEAYDASGGSFVELLVSLTTSDAFVYRHDPDEVEP